MRLDRLFVETLNDLNERVHTLQQPPNHDPVLHAASLLRLLLLDEPCLVDQVNRMRRLNIRYHVSDRVPRTHPAPLFWSVGDSFDPNTPLRLARMLELDRDKLLKRVVIAFLAHTGQQQVVRVQDLVLHLAHKADGVHAAQPKTDVERMLNEWNRVAAVGGYPPAVRSLCAVGRVVLKGLAPLKAAVERDLLGSTA